MSQVSCQSDPSLDQPIHINAKQIVIDTFKSKNIVEYDISLVFASDEYLLDLKKKYFGKNELDVGLLCLADLAKIKCDIVISGITGISGLHSAYAAINSGNDLAIANKETLVLLLMLFGIVVLLFL